MNPITMNLVADDIIRFALREDMNAGDLSTESVCSGPREAEVQLIAKAAGVIAGLDVFERAFTLLDPATTFDARVSDGDEVEPPVRCWERCAATPACCSPVSAWLSTSCSA